MANLLNRAREEFPNLTYTVYEEGNHLLVSIVTTLMHRVHKQIAESGELVFVYSSSDMEEYNLMIFFMLTQRYWSFAARYPY